MHGFGLQPHRAVLHPLVQPQVSSSSQASGTAGSDMSSGTSTLSSIFRPNVRGWQHWVPQVGLPPDQSLEVNTLDVKFQSISGGWQSLYGHTLDKHAQTDVIDVICVDCTI